MSSVQRIPAGVNAAAASETGFLSGGINTMDFDNFNDEELALFDFGLKQLSYMTSLERDLSNILLSQRDVFLWVASIAKKQFGLDFKGLTGTGGFNMQLIRPVTILSNIPNTVQPNGGLINGTPNPVLTWKTYFSSTGWQPLFGNQANPVSLGTNGPGNTATTTYQRVILVAPYLLSTAPSPKVYEIKPYVLQTAYPVYPLYWQKLSDLYIAKLPGALFVNKNGTFAIEANIASTGMDEIALFGLQFVTSDYAVLEK